jgi:acetylornithine/succinyldiaminopimelate/putrescine aminotransferase
VQPSSCHLLVPFFHAHQHEPSLWLDKHSTDFANKHITPGIGRVASDLIIERGKGSWVWTTDGRKWLDFTSGIGVTCLGEFR